MLHIPLPGRVVLASAGVIALIVGGLTTSASAIAAPGQTETTYVTFVDTTGVPSAGTIVSVNNVACNTPPGLPLDLGSPDQSFSDVTDSTGRISFPSFPSQCYLVRANTHLIMSAGSVSFDSVVASGSNSTLRVSTPQAITINTPGLPDGTSVRLYMVVKKGGVAQWMPAASGAVTAGKITLSAPRGGTYSVETLRGGDYYRQFNGGFLAIPGLTSKPGDGRFTTGTAATATVTANFKTSTPVNVSLSGFDTGSSISAMSLGTVDFTTPSVVETTTVPIGRTLRGLTPGRQHITVTGNFGAFAHYASNSSVIVKTGSTPVPVSLTGQVVAADMATNQLTPTATGAIQVGSKVTANAIIQGSAAPFTKDPQTTYSYYWYATDTLETGTLMAQIAEGKTLSIGSSLAHAQLITLRVIAKHPGQRDAVGTNYVFVSVEAYFAIYSGSGSLPLGNLRPAVPPVVSAIPTISGAAKVGATLTANPGVWSPKPSHFTYQWLRNGKAISGAKARGYRLTAADAGQRVSVRITAVLAGISSQSLTTSTTAKIGKATARIAVKAGKKKVTVTVKASGVKTATGKVTIKIGKKKATKRLAKGKATFKMTKGTYRASVTYSGDRGISKETMKTVKLRVR